MKLNKRLTGPFEPTSHTFLHTILHAYIHSYMRTFIRTCTCLLLLSVLFSDFVSYLISWHSFNDNFMIVYIHNIQCVHRAEEYIRLYAYALCEWKWNLVRKHFQFTWTWNILKYCTEHTNDTIIYNITTYIFIHVSRFVCFFLVIRCELK